MKTLERYTDWPERLAAKINECRIKPFEWGQHDCCLFAMDCVEVMTGVDLVKPYRGYTDCREAQRLLDQHGGISGIANTIAQKHSIPETLFPLHARRGDVCLFNVGRGDTIGVVVGEHIFAPGAEGLIGIPIIHAMRTWRIG